MPWSPQLGMNVFDPLQAYASGQPAAAAGAAAFRQARGQQMDEKELQAREDAVKAKATQQLHRQIGMEGMQAESQRLQKEEHMDPENANKQAFFKYSPMLFEGVERGGEIMDKFITSEEKAQEKRNYDTKLWEHNQQHAADAKEIAAGKQTIDLYKITQAATDKAADREIKATKAEAEAAKLSPQERERENWLDLNRQERTIKSQLNKPEDEYPGQAAELNRKLEDVQLGKQAWEVQHGAREETTAVDFPGGGGVKITKGAPPKSSATPTTAEETRLGNDLQATSNSLRVLNRLDGQLDSNAVGILPTLGTTIFDEVLGQFSPELVNQQRVSSRQNVGIATQQVLGELNNQGRISNMELSAIKNAMPGLGMMSSAAQGKAKIKELQKVLAEKGAHAAVALKRDIPSEIIQSLSRMTDDELATDAEQGALDPKVFWKIYRIKHPGAK